jgi:hypothetical protein
MPLTTPLDRKDFLFCFLCCYAQIPPEIQSFARCGGLCGAGGGQQHHVVRAGGAGA